MMWALVPKEVRLDDPRRSFLLGIRRGEVRGRTPNDTTSSLRTLRRGLLQAFSDAT